MANRASTLLTDRQVKTAKKSISVGGVKGLLLRVRETQRSVTRTFILRVVVNGVEIKRTLGNYPELGLEEARLLAAQWRKQILSGQDPKEELVAEKEAKAALILEKKRYSVQAMLLDWCRFGENRLWRSSDVKGHRVSRDHADIVNGYIKNHIPRDVLSMPASKLTTEILARTFSKQWVEMVDTPERIIGEIKRAFDYAVRSGRIKAQPNPADLNGKLRDLLPPDSERVKKGHHPALSPDRIPELFLELNQHPSVTAKLIMFSILTASRATNARLVTWPEIYLDVAAHPDAPMQITSRDEMKVRVIKFDRETPLSSQAVELLKQLPRFQHVQDHDFVFVKYSGGKVEPVSNAAAAMMLRKINVQRRRDGLEPFVDENCIRNGQPANISLHGTSRATFETWAYDYVRYGHRQFSEKGIEHCLDHVTEKYNNAYLRRAVIGEMREIFQAWGDYCFSISSNA